MATRSVTPARRAGPLTAPTIKAPSKAPRGVTKIPVTPLAMARRRIHATRTVALPPPRALSASSRPPCVGTVPSTSHATTLKTSPTATVGSTSRALTPLSLAWAARAKRGIPTARPMALPKASTPVPCLALASALPSEVVHHPSTLWTGRSVPVRPCTRRARALGASLRSLSPFYRLHWQAL